MKQFKHGLNYLPQIQSNELHNNPPHISLFDQAEMQAFSSLPAY